MEFTIPILPRMNAADAVNRWIRMTERNNVFNAVRLATMGQRPAVPLEKAHVTIERQSAGPEPDFENLAQGGKFILDALTARHKDGIGIIADDNPTCIGQPLYKWVKGKRGAGRVRVVVEAIQ
jgi:hypothetical protein